MSEKKTSNTVSAQQRRRQKARQAKIRRERADEQEYRDAVEMVPLRAKIAVVGLVVVFALSWVFSGRGTVWAAWPVSFLKAFVNLGWTTYLLILAVVAAVVLAVVVPALRVRRSDVRVKPARASGVTQCSVVLMLAVGLVLPVSGWMEARDILPSTTFSMCVNSLKKDASVALNDGDSGARYVTVASAGDGVRKYALEQSPDSAKWQVTDMYTNKPVSNLSGC